MRRRLLVVLLVFYAALVGALIVAPQVLANRNPSQTCTGALTHAATADLTVPSGAVCRVSASTVNGSVTVDRDAYFEAWGTKITGTVRASGALTVFLHDGTSVSGSVIAYGTAQLFLYKTTVGGMAKVSGALAPGYGHVQVCETSAGGIEVKGSGPDVLIGDPQGGCPGNDLKKDVVVVGNNTMSELVVSGNTITGSLVVTDNAGPSPKHVVGNTVKGSVKLANNAAPFDSSSSST